MFKWIKTNIQIVHILNSCDRKQFEAFVTKNINNPKLFISKWYIWNIIRGRDYYKMMAHYVVTHIQNSQLNYDGEDYNTSSYAERIVDLMLLTAKNDTIRRNFIWAIMKQVPLLTMDTIRYASLDKIQSLLQSDKTLVTDPQIGVFVSVINDLRKEVLELKDQVQMYQLMSDQD